MKKYLSWLFLWSALFLFIGSLFVGLKAHAADLILSTGTSSQLQNDWGENGNRSAMNSIRYAGDRFGVRFDRSVRGDDAGNYSLTGDVYARPIGGLVLAGGVSAFHDRLRGRGEKENFHAMIGWEVPHLFGPVGVGVWFDHWSNGRKIFNRDLPYNPPRNVLSFGAVVSF